MTPRTQVRSYNEEDLLNAERFVRINSAEYGATFVFRRRNTRDHFEIGIRTRELTTVPIEVFGSLTTPAAVNLGYSVATLEQVLVAPKAPFDFLGGEEDDFALEVNRIHGLYEDWLARFRKPAPGDGTLAGAAGPQGESGGLDLPQDPQAVAPQ